MAEILKEWLSQALERPINWAAEEFGNMMKNGHIVATVLQSYHVINDEKHYLIRSSNDMEDVKNNWKYLKEWLKDIEIILSDADLSNIMEGRGSSLLRLFYQLFLHLDRRDRTNFIKQEQKMVSSLPEKEGHRFKLDKVMEEQKSLVDNLSKPLLDERHFIEWQKRKAQQVKESFNYLRYKYSKITARQNDFEISVHYPKSLLKSQEKEKTDLQKFEQRHPCNFQNYTYEELIELEEKAKVRQKSFVNTDWAQNYMKNICQKVRKRSDSQEFQRQLSSGLSNCLWNACVTEEEEKLDTELAKKLMKLSLFEKQMCTQLMETKQQARNLTRNRIQGEKEYAEQREHHLHIFFDNLRDDITSGEMEFDFEQRRQNELHRKLYAEKIKRKRQVYYDICYETCSAIVDYAIKFGYYKKILDGDIPPYFIYEWKCLFFKQQPIFDVFTPVEDILKVKDESSLLLKTEEVITVERDRQETLNDCELKAYLDYSNQWCLNTLITNHEPESEERKFEILGAKILGHVIYTLLVIKYPYPSNRLPAELPKYTVKAILRKLPDKSLTQIIQILLNYRKILVVRLEAVINHCLRQYKLEMIGRKDVNLDFDNFAAMAQEDETKELIKSMKSEDEVLLKSREYNNSDLFVSTLPNTKQTQTPKSLPQDEMTMSAAACLGNYACDAFELGEPLTDYLLAAMTVEYLKDQTDVNGFVIINYPNNYEQAQILEEHFSGIAPPNIGEVEDNDNVLLEESILKHRKKEKDPYEALRVSRITKDPHIRMKEKPFMTYFTSYINLKQTSNISQELVVWELTQDNSDFVDRFYAVMGINYSIYYEMVDKELLAQICKFIIGDFSFPLKRNEELFGDKVFSHLDFPNSETKRLNSKIVKPDFTNGKSKEKLRRKSKTSKSTIEMDLEVIKAPHSSNEVPQSNIKTLESMIAHENNSKSVVSIEPIKVLAGEDGWIYADLPIHEVIAISIVSYWEEFEKSYVNKIQQLFFSLRLQMNNVVSYTRFLKDKMNQIINLPSQKQDLVSDFQNKYNNFDNDWRNVNVSKNEWHCRVKELQIKLYKICDERKIFAQQKKYALICDNWNLEELIILANTFISLMQMELNRSIITYQILHDFYFTMLKGGLPSDRVNSKDLTRISREGDSSTSGKKGGEEKHYKQLKSVFQDLLAKNVELDYGNNPLNVTVDNNAKFAMKVVKDLNDSYRAFISKDYNEKSKTTPTRKKEGNNSSESSKTEEILKQNTLKCLEEWLMGVNGEMFRFNLRIQALQHKGCLDMRLFYNQILKTFNHLQNNINNYYANEIISVDRLCKYIHMAIENEMKIPETLILEHDTFIIDPNVCQFAPVETLKQHESQRKIVTHSQFRISQLAILRSQMKMIAPTGLILHQAFIYLMQDFIIFGKECEEGPLFPETWKHIDPNQVHKLVFVLFGETAYIDWRDFLIYCLQLPFPSNDELLTLRKKFRCKDLDTREVISRNDFIKEKLWFEKQSGDLLRFNLLKHFLFELFETSQNLMNYSAFLLAFCKDVDPIKGFAAALSMAMGCKICYSKLECGNFVNNSIRAKRYKDASLACATKCAGQFLDKLIQNVLVICTGTTIEELKYVETITDEKKGKKGKGSKGKKTEANQSVRSTSSQKTLSQTKVKSSTPNSKIKLSNTAFQQTPKTYVEPTKRHDIIEEPQIDDADKNLMYAVNQSVIWNVLKICLPWHFQLLSDTKEPSYKTLLENIMKSLESETDNKDIYVCNLVSNPTFCKFLHKVKKFTAIDLSQEIYSFM